MMRASRFVAVSSSLARRGGPVYSVQVTALVFTGRVDSDAAALIGTAVACSASVWRVMLPMRVFYAYNDTRTPALLNLIMVTTKVSMLVAVATLLADRTVIVMLSVASSLAYVAGAIAGHILLRRRHGLLGFSTAATTVTRVVGATAAILAFAIAAYVIGIPELRAIQTLLPRR